jgi:hypothetical protein
MRQFNTLNQLPFLKELNTYQETAHAAQALWQSIAPDNLATLSTAISIKNQQLNLVTEYNSVAAKIKFSIPHLLSLLQKQGYEITAIQVKVQVKSAQPAKTKTIKKLSPHAADNLKTLAKQLEGTALGASLSKLADKAR